MENATAPIRDTPRPVGRPIDVEANKRILEAALRVYGIDGWSGLTMNAISREARVGKALLYSRHRDPGAVLFASFEEFFPVLPGNFESVRELLLAEARRMADLYLGPYSLAVQRVRVDAAAGIETCQRIQDLLTTRIVRNMRGHLHIAISSGELPPRTSVTMLLDIIEGAVELHCVARPEHREAVAAGIGTYTETLVDRQLFLLNALDNPEASASSAPEVAETGPPGEPEKG